MCLYTLFATYGPVLDIVALKTPKMRQQAHVVYRDVNSASTAMRALQGMSFLGREVVCLFLFVEVTWLCISVTILLC